MQETAEIIEEITDEEMGFIRQVIATPDDDAPRLVYADWLEERGIDPHPILSQVKSRIDCSPVWRTNQKQARLFDTLCVYDQDDRAPDYSPRKGFLEYLVCSLDWLKSHAPIIFRFHPIREVHITHGWISSTSGSLNGFALNTHWLERDRLFMLVLPGGREENVKGSTLMWAML